MSDPVAQTEAVDTVVDGVDPDADLRLHADKILATISQLQDRIDERFSGRGINERAVDLIGIATRAQRLARDIGAPIRWIRVCLIVLLMIFLVALAVVPFDLSSGVDRDAFAWLQIFETAMNDVILIVAGAAFLITLEARIKRRRCLSELHQLRSYAHVVDMM